MCAERSSGGVGCGWCCIYFPAATHVHCMGNRMTWKGGTKAGHSMSSPIPHSSSILIGRREMGHGKLEQMESCLGGTWECTWTGVHMDRLRPQRQITWKSTQDRKPRSAVTSYSDQTTSPQKLSVPGIGQAKDGNTPEVDTHLGLC